MHAENKDGPVVIADGEHPVYFPILVGGVPFRRQQHVEVNGSYPDGAEVWRWAGDGRA